MSGVASSNWSSIAEWFDDLVELAPAEREALLVKGRLPSAIASDVRSLLAAADLTGVFERRADLLLEPIPHDVYASLKSGTVVGPFVVDRLIGRGGMGEIYAAHRSDPSFEQRVALKLLRPEAAARTGLFDRERRLLAGLEHPGIARLIDGGFAPDGRPFMAMEFVEGEPIDAWCRGHAADLATRLALFREVCDAVAYAHARLIVHCDLKPSNILVDERGRARLLDFGVARLLGGAAASGTTQALVTVEYAAPEQLGNEVPTVATDIYALGAVLYALLGGRGPWAGDTSVPVTIRRILAADPALPSRIAPPDHAVAPAKLVGDLDAIVMKAMRRAPAERYRSVDALADDIDRHRRHEPVAARAGSTRYRVERFVRRYRWAVGASVAAVVALLIGTGGILLQARQTAVERDVALAEARRSESIVRMLTVMFRDSATTGSGENATVKQMLDQTAASLVASVDDSARSATLIATLFDLYVNLEDAAGADTLIRQAMAKGIGGGDPVATAQLKMRRASSAAALGKTDEMAPLLDAAETVFRTDPTATAPNSSRSPATARSCCAAPANSTRRSRCSRRRCLPRTASMPKTIATC